MKLAMKRFFNRFKFLLEKLLLRGAHYQLIVIALLILLVSFTAGFLGFTLTNAFEVFGDSAWWAFLRLSDPGYLGDDEGLVLQIISTVVTILGYVLFMGALIAIMSQWLQRTMRRLESGLTPITQNDHILILGWTNRTASIVRELVTSEGKVKRFLRRIGARKLHIVILAEEVTTALHVELKEALGRNWNDRLVTFRTGSPLRTDHLKRVDFIHAGAIIIPGADVPSDGPEGADIQDTRTIKSLLTVANYCSDHAVDRQPLVVAELVDGRTAPIVRNAYGPHIELVASDEVISRLIAQNVRHRGLSWVYNELLTHSRGNAVYVRELPRLTGSLLGDLVDVFPRAIVLGVIRPMDGMLRPILNPPSDASLMDEDRIVFLARTWSDTEPLSAVTPRERRDTPVPSVTQRGIRKRLLVLGWNQKVPALIRELQSYDNEHFEVDILSLVPSEERLLYLARHGFAEDEGNGAGTVGHFEGDYTSPVDLRKMQPQGYDNIVFLANNWLASHEESDARTILGYLVLQEILSRHSVSPDILVELIHPDNDSLFSRKAGEILVSSEIISHMMAHVALRRELSVVFEELFTVGGAEIYFRKAGYYTFPSRVLTFRDAAAFVSAHGDILLGYRSNFEPAGESGGIHLNPPSEEVLNPESITDLIVLTTYPGYPQ
jgi:ion channel POLLUX/CASTOR